MKEVVLVRESARQVAVAEAVHLRNVADLARTCAREARLELARGPRVTGQPDDSVVVDSAVVAEVAAALGIGEHQANAVVDLAMRLTQGLPETLTALEQGRLDMGRVRALVDATRVLDRAAAREVQSEVLAMLDEGPWDLLSPRSWRARLQRVVARVDRDAARRRQKQAVAERSVRTWAEPDGMGVLQLRAPMADIALADRVIHGLALASPSVDPNGQPLTMDQRRADIATGLFRGIADGSGDRSDVPRHEARPEREIGIVLHADTLLGDGPAANDPGEFRGLGAPVALDPSTASQTALQELARGARSTVLLTDDTGHLQRVVPVGRAPAGGWTREDLVAAVRAALPGLPPLSTDGYVPTVAITEHVRAKYPRCVAYDCARISRRCDLDHDKPWPRGPTDTTNLCPRCRRHHQHKTRRLVHTTLDPDGTSTTRMLTGITVTIRPEPLPGHGPGEGYDAGPGGRRLTSDAA
jgi:hypothetical protein